MKSRTAKLDAEHPFLLTFWLPVWLHCNFKMYCTQWTAAPVSKFTDDIVLEGFCDNDYAAQVHEGRLPFYARQDSVHGSLKREVCLVKLNWQSR